MDFIVILLLLYTVIELMGKKQRARVLLSRPLTMEDKERMKK